MRNTVAFVKRLSAAAAVVLAPAFLSGCIVVGTGGRSAQPTQGQELLDLQRAFEQEAITREEYDLARQRILSE